MLIKRNRNVWQHWANCFEWPVPTEAKIVIRMRTDSSDWQPQDFSIHVFFLFRLRSCVSDWQGNKQTLFVIFCILKVERQKTKGRRSAEGSFLFARIVCSLLYKRFVFVCTRCMWLLSMQVQQQQQQQQPREDAIKYGQLYFYFQWKNLSPAFAMRVLCSDVNFIS